MWSLRLRPYIGASEFDREPFAEWWKRVRDRIPNVPENVAEHWVHRHFGHSPYDFLPLTGLHFDKHRWPLQQLADVAFGADWGANASDLTRLDSPMIRQTPLAKMMIEAGTWPAPIIVLDNANGLADRGGAAMGRWHLLEGHQRLTYLRCLEHKGTARAEHELWIASLTAGPPGDPEEAEANDDEHGSLDYVWEKLVGAVQCLAIEDGSIQVRLSRACQGGLIRLGERDFPGDKREMWLELMEALERVKDSQRGSIEASCEAMGAREASHHARTIVHLFGWVCHMRGPEWA